MADRDPIAQRRKFVEAWNDTMIKIWTERIQLLDVINTGALLHSPIQLPVHADGRFYSFELSQSFLEYGIWQDLGTGREVPIGNPGDIGRDKVRQRRRWFSTKYYSSTLKLRDFMAMSIGNEFKSMFCASLDADKLRKQTSYYHRKGLS